MAFDVAGAKKAGYSDQEIQAYLSQQGQSNKQLSPLDSILKPIAQGPVGNAAEGLMRLINPRIASTAYQSGQASSNPSVPQPSMDQLAGAGGELVSDILPFSKVGILAKLGLAGRAGLAGAVGGATTPGADVGQRATNAATQGGLDAALGAVPTVAKKLVSPLSFLSPNAGKAVGAAHEAATAKGVMDSAPDVITEFKQAVEDKLGGPGGMAGDPALQKSFGKMLQVLTGRGDATPETLSQLDPRTFTGNFSPTDLVKGRQNIVSRFGYSPTDEGTLDQKVANIARDVLSKRAKDITPGLSSADQAFSRQQSLKDLLPALAKSVGIPGVAGAGAIVTLLNILKGNGQNQTSP